MITVIHIKDAPRGWKSNSKYVDISRAGKYGNPYPITNYRTREEAVEAFAVDLLSGKLGITDSDIIDLNDKILVCYCKPKLCHGDVYVARYEELTQDISEP